MDLAGKIWMPGQQMAKEITMADKARELLDEMAKPCRATQDELGGSLLTEDEEFDGIVSSAWKDIVHGPHSNVLTINDLGHLIVARTLLRIAYKDRHE